MSRFDKRIFLKRDLSQVPLIWTEKFVSEQIFYVFESDFFSYAAVWLVIFFLFNAFKLLCMFFNKAYLQSIELIDGQLMLFLHYLMS